MTIHPELQIPQVWDGSRGSAFFFLTNIPKDSCASDLKNTERNTAVNRHYQMTIFLPPFIKHWKVTVNTEVCNMVGKMEERESRFFKWILFFNSPFPTILSCPPSTRPLKIMQKSSFLMWACPIHLRRKKVVIHALWPWLCLIVQYLHKRTTWFSE